MTVTIEGRILRIHVTDPSTTVGSIQSVIENAAGQFDNLVMTLPSGRLIGCKG